MENAKHIINEKTGLSYTKVGDYYLPDIALNTEKMLKEVNKQILLLGKYGKMKNAYMLEHQKPLYYEMLENGTLIDYLKSIDDSAERILWQTIKAFSEADGCDENLKSTDQMKWVGFMNNYRHSAEEIIYSELISE